MPDRPATLAPPRWLALRWLLVTVTGTGLIAMHTLMGVGGGHCAGAATDAMTTSTPVLMAARAPMTAPAPMAGNAPMTAHAPMTAPAPMAGNAPVSAPAPTTAQSGATGHPGHHGDGSMSMVAHLCLAVLGLLLLALAAPAVLGWFRHDADRITQLAGYPAGAGQPRAPPPTNVRLAQLCISRR
jgi:hypothetical protein